MSKNIDNVDTYGNRTKVYTKKWRPIYEVIYESYIKGSKGLPDEFIKEC